MTALKYNESVQCACGCRAVIVGWHSNWLSYTNKIWLTDCLSEHITELYGMAERKAAALKEGSQ